MALRTLPFMLSCKKMKSKSNWKKFKFMSELFIFIWPVTESRVFCFKWPTGSWINFSSVLICILILLGSHFGGVWHQIFISDTICTRGQKAIRRGRNKATRETKIESMCVRERKSQHRFDHRTKRQQQQQTKMRNKIVKIDLKGTLNGKQIGN